MLVFEKSIFAILSLSLLVLTRAYSNSQVGDLTVEKTDDKFICGMTTCPPETVRCFISKSNKKQPSILKIVNICFSENGTVLVEKKTSSPINANVRVSQYVNSYQSGSISTGDDAIKNIPKEVEENLKTEANKIQNYFKSMQHKLQNLFA